MPSIRLLSIVRLWFAPRGTIKWVPWQLRMSQRQYQDIMEARTSRTLRTEAQLVSSALFDETPELSIERAHLSPAWLARTQQIFRNAIALCGGAHLAVLKAFDKKILDICTQSLAPDSGLRTVNTHELLNADRKLWNEISSLHSEGWTLDEAVHEMTSIRADTHALLQPRARPPARKGPGKGNKSGKGNGKKGGKVQTRLKDDRQVAALTETMKNLQLKRGNKTLCLRFNRAECNDKNCKFAHLCAVRLPNGQRRVDNVTLRHSIALRLRPTNRIRRHRRQPKLDTRGSRRGCTALAQDLRQPRAGLVSHCKQSSCLLFHSIGKPSGCTATSATASTALSSGKAPPLLIQLIQQLVWGLLSFFLTSSLGPTHRLPPPWRHSNPTAFSLSAADAAFDSLDNAHFCRLLLRTASSGLLGALWSAPPCKEFSRLKLRRPGPKALRTPEHMDGVPDNSPAE